MKKLIALLLTLVMVLSMTACGGSAAPAATEAPKADAPAAEAPAAPAADSGKTVLNIWSFTDEVPKMIDRYLERGTMYILEDGGVKCECVVTDEGDGILEIKNIATAPESQRKGYAAALIDFLIREYAGRYSVLQVGTGDSPLTIPFYEKCGFSRSHILPNFFTDNYDHPIYECGVLLTDMVYLQRTL